MRALRFSNADIDAVSTLVELHLRFHGYGSGEWTDSAVRRYVRDAGDQLERLHILTRADCTTRNQRKADRLRRTYDSLEERIARLSEQEELASIRPDLDGNEIMEILGIGPGREVGEAYRFLLELRMDEGNLTPDEARTAPAGVVGPPLASRPWILPSRPPMDSSHLPPRSTRGVTEDVEPLIEESVEVAADPARVWSLVSDLPRLAEWSPQVVRSFVRTERPIRLGTRLVNVNRRGLLVWPTQSKVVRFEPHQEIALPGEGQLHHLVLHPGADRDRHPRRAAPRGAGGHLGHLRRLTKRCSAACRPSRPSCARACARRWRGSRRRPRPEPAPRGHDGQGDPHRVGADRPVDAVAPRSYDSVTPVLRSGTARVPPAPACRLVRMVRVVRPEGDASVPSPWTRPGSRPPPAGVRGPCGSDAPVAPAPLPDPRTPLTPLASSLPTRRRAARTVATAARIATRFGSSCMLLPPG